MPKEKKLRFDHNADTTHALRLWRVMRTDEAKTKVNKLMTTREGLTLPTEKTTEEIIRMAKKSTVKSLIQCMVSVLLRREEEELGEEEGYAIPRLKYNIHNN